MINEIIYRWRLNKLQRSRRKALRFYRKRIKEAEKKKDDADADYEIHCMSTDMDEIEGVIGQLVAQRLFWLADKYLLPRPEFGDIEGGAWEKGVGGLYRLKPEAMAQLRAMIRKEQKARSEHMRLWLVPLTGLVGAISGLIAVIGALLSQPL